MICETVHSYVIDAEYFFDGILLCDYRLIMYVLLHDIHW